MGSELSITLGFAPLQEGDKEGGSVVSFGQPIGLITYADHGDVVTEKLQRLLF